MKAKEDTYNLIDPASLDSRYDRLNLKPIESIEFETICALLSTDNEDKKFKIIVLDVGCGTGRLSPLFNNDLYVGIDLCKKFIKYCYTNKLKNNRNFVMADLNYLPFKKGCFDVILLIGTFESELTPNDKIAKLSSYLKPNGKILFTLQNNRNLIARIANYFGQSYPKTYWSLNYIKKHFGSEGNRSCLIQSNFVIPPGILREIFSRIIKSNKLRKIIVMQCMLIERINLSYNLNLGYEWKICITRG